MVTSKNVFRILVVDDNRAIHEDFRKILIPQAGHPVKELKNLLFNKQANTNSTPTYKIDSVYQGEKAVSLVEESLEKKDPFAVAFIDTHLPPGADGLKTIGDIWSIDPNIQVVICTASGQYTSEKINNSLEACPNLIFLRKPFDAIEIRQLIYSLAHKWDVLKKMERQISYLEDYFHLVEFSPCGIILQKNTDIIYTNNTFMNMVGADDPAQIVGGSISKFIDTSLQTFIKNRLLAIAEGDTKITWSRGELIKIDNSKREIELTVSTSSSNQDSFQILIKDILSDGIKTK